MHHDLKCHPAPFKALRQRIKPFEVRRNDRNFLAGDLLTIREYLPNRGAYTGDAETFIVSYVFDSEDPLGKELLKPGYCVLGLIPAQMHAPTAAPEPPRAPDVPQMGVTIGATIKEVTPVAILVLDDHGERHVLMGQSYRPGYSAGTRVRLKMQSFGWEIIEAFGAPCSGNDQDQP